MGNELIKKVQNLEVLPSQRANDLFKKRQSQLVSNRSRVISSVAASVILGSLTFLLYLNQVKSKRFTKGAVVVQKHDYMNKEIHSEEVLEIAQKVDVIEKKQPVIARKNHLSREQNILQEDTVQNELKYEEDKPFNRINEFEINKIASTNAFLFDVHYAKVKGEIDEKSWINISSNFLSEEEVKKGDAIMQELMLLKYGEIVEEKVTIAKLFTKEDNFLYNEANEFKSRVNWFKSKLSK